MLQTIMNFGNFPVVCNFLVVPTFSLFASICKRSNSPKSWDGVRWGEQSVGSVSFSPTASLIFTGLYLKLYFLLRANVTHIPVLPIPVFSSILLLIFQFIFTPLFTLGVYILIVTIPSTSQGNSLILLCCVLHNMQRNIQNPVKHL